MGFVQRIAYTDKSARRLASGEPLPPFPFVWRHAKPFASRPLSVEFESIHGQTCSAKNNSATQNNWQIRGDNLAPRRNCPPIPCWHTPGALSTGLITQYVSHGVIGLVKSAPDMALRRRRPADVILPLSAPRCHSTATQSLGIRMRLIMSEPEIANRNTIG